MTGSKIGRLGVVVGAAGMLAAITTAVMTPAFGVSATSPAPIKSVHKAGPIALTTTDTTLVSLSLPAGHWLIIGKMWADSVTSQPTTNTVVGCSLWKGGTFLDNSAFNTPKVGGSGGSSAGINELSAVVALRATAKIFFKCSDFGSHANAHSVVLSAVG